VWHHVVAGFDRDAGITIYVDGLSRFNAGAISADVSNTGPFLVGKSTGYGYFTGDIDEVAVYPSLLAAARVQAHHDAGRGVGGAGATALRFAGATASALCRPLGPPKPAGALTRRPGQPSWGFLRAASLR
jgi:hypothetical protein